MPEPTAEKVLERMKSLDVPAPTEPTAQAEPTADAAADDEPAKPADEPAKADA
jgi:hypothetical protein